MERLVGSGATVFLVAAFSLASACESTPAPPPVDEASSMVVVRLKQRAPIRILPYQHPGVVYFARLDESGSGSYVGTDVEASNYFRDGYYYLVNARPGRYVAVASLDDPEADQSFFTCFSEELVRQTEVTVAPDEIVFMGEFDVQLSTKAPADRVQAYYLRLLREARDRTTIAWLLKGSINYTGNLNDARTDEEARQRFRDEAGAYLLEAGWDPSEIR